MVEHLWPFGNHEAAIELIRKIAYREGFGDILAEGVEKASEKIGRGSRRYALTVKGQEIEGMPQRNLCTAALGVATSEDGPDHTRWYPLYPPNPAIASPELLKELHIDIDLKKAFILRSPEGKAHLMKWLTDRSAILESIPTCLMVYARGILGVDLRLWTIYWRPVLE